MTTENTGRKIDDPTVAALTDQLDGLRPFVYLASRDQTADETGVTERYSRILQYMLLATIEANPQITEQRLYSLMCNTMNVPESVCAWQLTIMRNARLPDSTHKLLYVYPAKHTSEEVGGQTKVVRHLAVNKKFDLRALAAEYSILTNINLSEFIPETFNARSGPRPKHQNFPVTSERAVG